MSLLLIASWLSAATVWWGIAIALAIGLVSGTILLVRHHWQQTRELARHPFSKYVALSLIAHITLGIWAYFSNILEIPNLGSGEPSVVVQLGDPMAADEETVGARPWDPPDSPAISPDIPEPVPATVPEIETDRPEVAPVDDMRVDSPLSKIDAFVEEPTEIPPWADEPEPIAPSRVTDSETTQLAETAPPKASVAEPFAHTPKESAQEVVPLNQNDAPQVAEVTEHPSHEAVEPTSETETGGTEPRESPELVRAATETNDSALQPVVPRPNIQTQPLQPVNNAWRPPGASRVPISTIATPRRRDGRPIPEIYRDRWAENRLQLARSRGGDADAEAAVAKALRWLAAAQTPDGHWDASQFGAGRGGWVEGQSRTGVGQQADTGITGLALLAFLGSGHTHLTGDYAENVRRGIEYLIQKQRTRSDGALIGRASLAAAMYCHGIATLALSESYSLTGDDRLATPLQQAIGFSLAAQHPTSGGWRYRPHEQGDTSQLGWQLMALISALHGGMQVPDEVWYRSGRFLTSVSHGSYGGLASYRPYGRISRPMTSEALLCRLLLGGRTDDRTALEAAEYIVQELPGSGQVNYYYWYYATLALYHLQDDYWRIWNRSVKQQLVGRQRKSGTEDGSWDPDSIWGSTGGRVYTTALATLTLEVYYRFKPLATPRVPERTAWRSRR